jgi:branched-subunit amino acid aminotransferase/4-amino-4-deoxychorismate lyase
MRLDIGISQKEVIRISQAVARRNAALLKPQRDLGLIHFVTPGEYKAYAGAAGGGPAPKPTVCIHTFPMPFHLWADLFRTGAHVVTPSIRHIPPQCIDPKMKYRSRMHWFLADGETHQADPKATSLLLDLDGNITECSGSNFLVVQSGMILSPTTRNILPGISRQVVIEMCQDLAIPFAERDLQVHDVVNADEALLSTTPYCLAPVTKINGIPIGDGKPGPMFKRLIERWGQLVEMDIVKQIMDSK